MKSILYVVGISFALFVSSANADVVARCGALEGYTFVLEGPLVKKEDSGWEHGGVTGGSTSIIFLDNRFDIIFSDTTGTTRSARADGAEIHLLGLNKGNGTILLELILGTTIQMLSLL